VLQVTGSEAAGFREDTEYPGQAQSLHPGRRIRLGPRINVESKADGQDDATRYLVSVPLDPSLLLRCPQSDPNKIRGEPPDFLQNLGFLFRSEVSIAATYNSKKRALIEESLPKPSQALIRTA